MVTGIPNVGKSTLINKLAGKNITKVGDEPAVTKQQQKVYLKPKDVEREVILHDTPGILWPKIHNPHSGYRLAILGSIKNTATDYDDLGCYASETLLHQYPEALSKRYGLSHLPASDIELLESIGAKRGAKQSKGRINLHKVSEILIHDIRSGALGKLSLETPDMIQREIAEVTRAHAEKEEKQQQRKNKRKNL